MNIEQFREMYPLKTLTILDRPFAYRYYKNPKASETLVLLTGGIGISDTFYLHFEWFAKEFSVITFDYHMQYKSNKEFADAVALLLKTLGVKAWLVGQSLGGVVAQIIAAEHPEAVEGMVLSNTCSLAKDMAPEGRKNLEKMLKDARFYQKLIGLVPIGLYKRLMVKSVNKLAAGFTPEEKATIQDLTGAIMELLTKPYARHMMGFLVDAENHQGMEKKTFAPWEDKVLLILSRDDDTFNAQTKQALINVMTKPTVVDHLVGGHLALLIRLEEYGTLVSGYIKTHS